MGESAVTQNSEEAGAAEAHQSGRYAIDPKLANRTQPSAAAPAEPPPPMAATPTPTNSANSAILSVHRLSEEELSWIDARKTQPPARALPVIAPAAPSNSNAEEEPPTLGALRPYYREPTLERVQLQFEDRSLDPAGNPLALSSLKPPAPRGLAKWLELPGMHSALIGVGALALIGVGYLAAVASTGTGRQAVTTFAPASETSLPRVELVAPDPELEVSAAEEESTGVLWSSPARNAPEPEPEPEPEKPAAAASAAPAPPANVAPPIRPRAVRRRAPAPPVAPPSTGLPTQPTREEIKSAVEALRATLQACAGTGHGLTTARITIVGNGRVSSANIEGAFAGTPEGSCMARALRTATFPRFSAPTLQVTYPFRL